MKFTSHVTEITIIPEGEPIFDERGYTLSIKDEAAGPFITIRDNVETPAQCVEIDPDAWPHIKNAADKLIKICKNIESPA
jgi:hypothetical protein